MSFGDVIRSASSPGAWPGGIGGDATTIWHCDFSPDKIFELSIIDLSVIRSTSSPSSSAKGIGGNATVIWHNDSTSDKIYELSVVDFSVIRSASSPSTGPTGTGGDNTTIWHCDATVDDIYELSTIDFSVVRSTSSPGSSPMGIGGDNTTIWHGDASWLMYELSTTDFSVVRSTGSPSGGITGIGGSYNLIWECDYGLDKIFELDAAYVPPTYTISGNVKDSDGNNLDHVTITLEDGIDYSTTTDASGNYSQAVTPDVYTVKASLIGYLDGSASVDASASNQTQNFTLLKPIISGNVKNSNGTNLPGVAISLEDGTDYSTNTDINGDYLQVVDPDIYDVVASIPSNTDQSASVDASTADQTQDFIFPITTAPHDKAIRLIERHLLE